MPRKNNVTDEMISSLYEKGTPLQQMTEFSGLTDRAIRNIMTKHNIPKRSTGQPRKHKVNEHYFNQWRNEMTWVLGLIVTDGNLNKSTQLNKPMNHLIEPMLGKIVETQQFKLQKSNRLL